MSKHLEQAVNRLWLTYKLYGEVSKNQFSDYDSDEFATQSTNGFLEYINEMMTTYPAWKDNLANIIENECRIVKGFIECYDRPVKREKITEKTRWSV